MNKDNKTMANALQNVPQGTRDWFKATWDSIVGNNGKAVDGNDEHELGAVPQKTTSFIKNTLGKDITRQIITAKGVEHIYIRHGRSPQKELADGQIPISAGNVAIIADVLANPDDIRVGHPTGAAGKYETVNLLKEYDNGTVHVIGAIVDGDTLKVWTAFIWDKEKTNRARSASSKKSAASPATMPLGSSLDPNAPDISNITPNAGKVN